MDRIISVLLALIIGTAFSTTAVVAQERAQGVSLHMLPKRVAQIGEKPWGFTVDFSSKLKREPQQPTIQTAGNLLAYPRKQTPEVQQNGLWIVTTDPDAYSEAEKALLENVKAMCRREKIPLFICRASELPNGWVRFDK